MSKKLSRKEKEYLIAKELAKEKYKKLDELQSNGEYERIELDPLRKYNRGKYLPLLVFFGVMITAGILVMIVAVSKYNEEPENIAKSVTKPVVHVSEKDEQAYKSGTFEEVEAPEKTFVSAFEGTQSNNVFEIEKNVNAYSLSFKTKGSKHFMDNGFNVVQYNMKNKPFRTEYKVYSDNFNEIFYVPIDVSKVEIQIKEDIKWEVKKYHLSDIPHLKPETYFETNDFMFAKSSDNCMSIFAEPVEEDTTIEYGIYDERFDYYQKSKDLISKEKRYFSQFDNNLIKFEVDKTTRFYCT